MIFIILWLISPIALLILFLVQIGKCSDLRRQNAELAARIRELLAEKNDSAQSPANDLKKAEIQNIPTEIAEEKAEIPAKTAAESTDNSVPPPVSNPFGYNLPTMGIPAVKTEIKPVAEPSVSAVNIAETTQTSSFYASQAAAPKSSISTINIILILGALLISLSGFIFAIAAWGIMNTFFKAVVLLSFSVLFFGIHSFTERKLKLPQTGRVFYILGSIFLPAAIVAAGALKVFGEYLSFSGDGKLLVFSAVFLSVCIPFFKGAHDYKNRFFSAVSHYSFSASVIFLIWHLSPHSDIAMLVSSVFALAITLLEPVADKIYTNLFGEDNVFSAEYSRFSVANAMILGIVSMFALGGDLNNILSLAAFAVFSLCFLTKTVTKKSGAFGAISFAFFITVSLFSGFNPDEVSGYTCIIAATSLIYAVLSAMGLFPEILRKIMKVLALIAACIAGALGIIENIILIADGESPSWQLIIAAAAVFVQLILLAVRHKTDEYKALSFAAFLWLSAEISLLVYNSTAIGIYAAAIAYAIVLVYFIAVRFLPLKKWLYTYANDIIIAFYAVICSALCILEYGYIPSIAILAAGIICALVSNKGKTSAAICSVLTFQIVLPLAQFLGDHNIYITEDYGGSPMAVSVILILLCVIASVMLFIPKARNYKISYGITVISAIPVFTCVCIANEFSDFIPMLAVTVYTALYLAKSAFPNERYSHVNLLSGAVVLTSIFMGAYFTDSIYLFCFPAVAVMLVFAVYAIGFAFDTFEKTGKHIEHFVWYAASILGGLMLLISNNEGNLAVCFFGIVLVICGLFTSVLRRNTLNMIFPIIAAIHVFASRGEPEATLVTAFIFAVLGRILFHKKMFDKLYIDAFSIGALISGTIYAFSAETDLKQWFAIISLAFFTLNLIRREHSPTANRCCLTASALFPFPIVWLQPFFEVPDMIDVQFNLLPVVIFCILLKFIWKNAPAKVDNFSFAAAIFSLVVLFIASLSSGEPFDAVFIGIVLFIMLAVSFIIKKKRWFVLAVASMVASAVILSFGQRDSIAWLVYLALAGAALIVLGVINELKKQQKRSGEETKLSRFMSDWTW